MTSAPASQSDSCVPEITLSGSPVLAWRRRRSYRYRNMSRGEIDYFHVCKLLQF